MFEVLLTVSDLEETMRSLRLNESEDLQSTNLVTSEAVDALASVLSADSDSTTSLEKSQ